MSALRLVIATLLAILLNNSNEIFAWDNDMTHKDLSQYAAENSILANSDYLKSLGLSAGLSEKFFWNSKVQSALKWLQEGAYLEDAGSNLQGIIGMARYNNHFHNPLKPWGSAGLNDLGCTGESAVLWAQYGSWQTGYIEGDWSWKKARDSLYSALTSKYDSDRRANFAQTFRGLGHQMHLIQDMSVPAHVRNDAHPRETLLEINPLTGDYYFETWARKNAWIINSFASAPVDSQVRLDISQSGFAPVSQLVDTEQYAGAGPSISLTWGLSEYTNSNFLSDNTIFTENFSQTDGRYFPYPRYNGRCYELITEHLSAAVHRTYLRKTCEGEPINHFAAISPFYSYLGLSSPSLQRSAFVLDAAVHREYTSKLIPRAVGYSSSLLNYFFRGDIDMVFDDDTGSGFVIVNNTDEDMNGIFELWYDNRNDERGKTWSASLSIGRKSSGNNRSSNIALTSPVDAKEPDKYMLVFKGKMGGEDNAVAGKIVELAGEYLFLAGAWHHNIQTYRLLTANGSYQLIPAQKKVNIKYSTDNGIWGRNLTIQSNPEMTEHYAVLPLSAIDASGKPDYPTYRGSISNYGVGAADYCYWNWWFGYTCDYTYSGSAFYYRPADFTAGSPYILSHNHLSVGAINPHPIASGRRPFEITNDKLSDDDISIWQDQDNIFTRHKDENGNWIRDVDLPNGTYFAAIARNQAIYKTSEQHRTETQGDSEEVYDQCHYIDETFTSISSGTSETTQKENFIFGAYPIESLEYSDSSSTSLTDATTITCNGWGDAREYTLRGYNYYGRGQGRLFGALIDYDNANGDDSFIVFYALKGISMQNSGIEVPFSNINIDSFTINGNLARNTDEIYKMVYKVGELPQIVELGRTTHSETEHITFYGFGYDDYGSEIPITEASHTSSISGSRISGVSSQINRKSLVYTYNIEEWDNALNKYVFDKRIIGIINISGTALPVGYRQEFELYLPGSSFDFSALAAIGVTK